ncbi:hypothetical protein MRX96_023079 [Rhipicephalus microplus]
MRLARSNVRLLVLIAFYFLFIVIGASIFSTIEAPHENAVIRRLRAKRAAFLEAHPCVKAKGPPRIPEVRMTGVRRTSSEVLKDQLLADRRVHTIGIACGLCWGLRGRTQRLILRALPSGRSFSGL